MDTPGPEEQAGHQSSGPEFLFEQTTDCIVEGSIRDGEPIVHRVNEAFENVFGYTNSELRGENLNDHITPDGKRKQVEAVDQEIRDGDVGPRVVTRQTADGPRDFLLRATAGEGERSYAIYTDITAQKERERQLQRERDRLDGLIGIISHDLRNPLNVAQGRVKLALEECDSDHLEVVAQAHDRMERLIEDMLSLARAGESLGDVEPVAIAELAESSWLNVETKSAELILEIESTVNADESRLRQLLENLYRNAIEHGGDDVTVTIGGLDGGFYVEDDGPGIPKDERDEVFEAGYSRNEDGFGFGLSIVKEVAMAHGWDTNLSQGAEGGARFEFTGVEVDRE